MPNKIVRRGVCVLLLLGIAVLVRLWPDKHAQNAMPFTPPGKPREPAASTSRVEATPVMPTAPVARGTAVSDTTAGPQRAPVQINVDAPATVRAGDSFEATVNLEAYGGIRQLAFLVTFDKRVLQFVGSSKGLFVQQAGAPVQFDAEDPSDGYVLVNLDVNNGYVIAGAGSVVILQFQALKSGVAPIALNNITFVDNVTAGASTTTSAHEVLVTVE